MITTRNLFSFTGLPTESEITKAFREFERNNQDLTLCSSWAVGKYASLELQRPAEDRADRFGALAEVRRRLVKMVGSAAAEEAIRAHEKAAQAARAKVGGRPGTGVADDGTAHVYKRKAKDKGKGQETDDRNVRLFRARDLTAAEQPRWLAKGGIPRASVSLLVGDEGIGKSLLWVWVAAAVTTGKPLPEFGIPAREPGRVRLVITEDVWSQTVLPRLEVAGADLDMVDVICEDEDGSGAPVFPDDMEYVTAEPRPVLVVVDAWLDTVPAKLSVRDPQQARQALHPWKEAATTTDAAVLLLTHTNAWPRPTPATSTERPGNFGRRPV